MKTLSKSLLTALVLLMIATTVLAQEWSKEQMEVWKVVKDGWDKWKTGDVNGMGATVSEKYQGWSDQQALPMNKKDVMEWYSSMKDMVNVNRIFLNPARIVVTKDAAVVDYYFHVSGTMTMNGKSENSEFGGKNAEFYVKEDGKWMLLGDMTVHHAEGMGQDDED